MLGHVSRMPPSADAYKAIYWDIPSDWQRRPGRPRQSWLATIHRDLRQLNINLDNVPKLAADRLPVEGVDSWHYAPLWCMLLMMSVYVVMCWYYFLAESSRKLDNACGNLVNSLNVNEHFLSHMMCHGVLSPDKKKDIQTVGSMSCFKLCKLHNYEGRTKSL